MSDPTVVILGFLGVATLVCYFEYCRASVKQLTRNTPLPESSL